MRSGTIFAAVVFAALSFVGNAVAAAPDGPGPWADYVVDYNQGCAIQPPDTTTCFPVFGNRSDPTAALGVAESPPGPTIEPAARLVLQPGLQRARERHGVHHARVRQPDLQRARGTTWRSTSSRSRRSPTRPRRCRCSSARPASRAASCSPAPSPRTGTVGIPAPLVGRELRQARRRLEPGGLREHDHHGRRVRPRRRACAQRLVPAGKDRDLQGADERDVGQALPVLAERRPCDQREGRLLLGPDHHAGRRQPGRRAPEQPAHRRHRRDDATGGAIIEYRPGQPHRRSSGWSAARRPRTRRWSRSRTSLQAVRSVI